MPKFDYAIFTDRYDEIAVSKEKNTKEEMKSRDKVIMNDRLDLVEERK